jgi:hypothetical protein
MKNITKAQLKSAQLGLTSYNVMTKKNEEALSKWKSDTLEDGVKYTWFLTESKGGTLPRPQYDELHVASMVTMNQDTQYFTDGAKMKEFTPSQKNAEYTWKSGKRAGTTTTVGNAFSRCKSDAQSRMAKMADDLNPEVKTLAGRKKGADQKAPTPPVSDEVKMREAINKCLKIAEKAELPIYDVVALTKALNDAQRILSVRITK